MYGGDRTASTELLFIEIDFEFCLWDRTCEIIVENNGDIVIRKITYDLTELIDKRALIRPMPLLAGDIGYALAGIVG